MERSRSRVDAGSNAPGGGGGGVGGAAANYSDSYDYLFKFLVIGSAGTGKSCLLHHFIEGRFKEDSSHTIGVEFGSKIVPVGGKTVKLQVRHRLDGKPQFLSRLHQMYDILLLTDLGHSWAGTFSVSDKKLLQGSSG